MAHFGRKTAKPRTDALKNSDGLTPHQERVYGEFFKAIEQVGRRLERTEDERDRLANRVANLEAHAERDELTGNYFLPVRMDTNDDSQNAPMPKSVMAASFTSIFVALIALGVVLTQEPTLSQEQIAALQFNPPQYANLELQSPNWQKVGLSSSANRPAASRAGNETIETVETTENMEPAVIARDDTATLEQTRPSDAELSEIVSEPDPLIQSILASLDETAEPDSDLTLNNDNVDVAIQKNIEPETGEEIVLNIPIEDIVPASGTAQTDEGEDTPTVATADLPKTEETNNASVDVLKTETIPVEAKKPVVATKPAPSETVTVQKPVIQKPVKKQTVAKVVDIEPDPNLPPSVKTLEQRAMQGVAESQHDLATLYAAGNAADLNYGRAIYWFNQAAEGGIANAHYNLGVMAHQGLGQETDMVAALKWYQNAAELGHPEALYNLGIAYTEGIGAAQDIERGASYFKRAAEVGVTQAAYNLGILYESSFLGGIDKPEAAKYYKMAAEGGHQDAAASYARVTGNVLDITEPDTAALQTIEPAAGGDYDLIQSIQSVLITEKYLPGNASGVLGVQTIDAIKSYEKANGLPVTGEASRELLAFMRAK